MGVVREGDGGWIFKPKWFASRFIGGEVELHNSELHTGPKDALSYEHTERQR